MEARSLLLAALLAWATAPAAQDERSWTIGVSHEADTAQTVLGQDHAPQRQTIAVRRAFDAATRALGQHEYRILDLPAVDGRAADTNHDGVISVTELTDYLARQVPALTEGTQQPGIEMRFQSDILAAGL